MKTIIQTIGPLYGASINGSVFGQPNGSEARPPQDRPASVTISGDSATLTFTKNIPGGSFVEYALAGVSVEIVSGVTVVPGYVVKNAGDTTVATGVYPSTTLRGPGTAKPTDGDSLTLTIELTDTLGNVVATSDALTITAEVPSS